MDARAGYIKKRNIFIALLLLAAVVAVMVFVFRAAQTPEPEEERGAEEAPGWSAPEDEPYENRLGELLGSDLPNGETVVYYYGDVALGVAEGSPDPSEMSALLSSSIDPDLFPEEKVTWRVEKTSDYPVSFNTLLRSATEAVLDETTEACGLYVQNGFVGATPDEVTAQNALRSFLAAAKKERSLGDNSTVELPDVSCRSCVVAKRMLMDDRELEALLARCCNEKLTVGGVDYEKIRNYAEKIELPSQTLLVRTVETVTETIEMSFDTVALYDYSQPEGYYKLQTEGKTGLYAYYYSVTYENGVQVSKTLVGEETLVSPVDRVIVKGVRQFMLWPLRTPDNMRVTSPFGVRVHPITGVVQGHTGVDLAGPASGDIFGDNIYAAMDGVVTTAVVNRGSSGYGTYIIIDHGEKLGAGKTVCTLYGHCEKIFVTVGQTVKKGDVIGIVGSTGASTGPHLHFEVRVNGEFTDPLTYLYLLELGSSPVDPKYYVK